MTNAPIGTGRPPSPALVPAVLVAAVVAVAGFGVLALLPPRLSLHPHVVGPYDFCIPVDALAVAQHDFAFGDRQHVLLGRLTGGKVQVVWQNNYFTQSATPTSAVDVDGDGTEELCLTGGDSLNAYAWGIGADGREVTRVGPLRGLPERLGDPWDVRIEIDDALERDGQHMLVCRKVAGFARRPRAITLVDATTREPVWEYELGTIAIASRSADVDGDGADEVLVTTGAPDNGVTRNGTDDSHAYVMALGADGGLRWKQALGGPFSMTAATVLPRRDARPTPRVVATYTCYRARRPDPGRLLVLDGVSGEVLVSKEFPGGLGQPHALVSDGGFVVGSDDGMVRRFDAQARMLRARDVGAMAEVWAVADLDGDGEQELVVSTTDEVLALGEDLEERGNLEVRHAENPVRVQLASAGVGHARLAVADGRALILDVVPRPGAAEPIRVAGVLGLALAAGASVPVLRAHRRRHMPTGAGAREFLLDYHQIRHETFETERPFARVRLWAQAHAAGVPLSADALDAALTEFEQLGSPSLMRYAERAAAVGVSRSRVRSIREHARRVGRGLAEARALPADESAALVRAALDAVDALAQDCYEAYWEVVMRAPCRVNVAAAQAMMGKTVLLERLRVLTRYEADPGAREPVLFDPDELRALIGELLENAARALTGVPDATLEVLIKEHPTDPRRIVFTVRDNGTGIPPGMRETLFDPDTSTREGGGFGLFHAREVARRWMAELTLEDPPGGGRGSEARLMLRACRVVDWPWRPGAPPGGRQ